MVILLKRCCRSSDGQPGKSWQKQPPSLSDRGGYFCVLLLSLPKVYPIPKQVKPKLSTAISPKISIWLSPPFPDSLSGFYVNGGSQSLRRGLTAYHPSSPNEILSQFDRNFNQILFSWNTWKVFKYESQNNLTKQKERLKNTDFTHFSARMSAIRTPYSYNIIVKYLIAF